MVKDPKKVAEGKRSRIAGKAFEEKVYTDLEKKDWIASRWMKNVEILPYEKGSEIRGNLIPAKPKIRMIPRVGPILVSTWTGFPDFIAYKKMKARFKEQEDDVEFNMTPFGSMGVECKMSGKLDKEEKEKCQWLLDNEIFGKIYIASKGKKRGEIIYKEFVSEEDLKGGKDAK